MGNYVLNTIRLTADRTNSTTSLADVTGLQIDLQAGEVYSFQFWIIFQSAAITTGIQFAMAGPSGSVVYNVGTPTSATATTVSNRRGANQGAATTGIDTANANSLAMIYGICAPTSAGTLIVRFASEVPTSTVTVKAGSFGSLMTL